MAKRKKMEAAASKAAPEVSGSTTPAAVDRDRIAARAYELYLARGRQDGRAMDDWLSAERELQGSVRGNAQ